MAQLSQPPPADLGSPATQTSGILDPPTSLPPEVNKAFVATHDYQPESNDLNKKIALRVGERGKIFAIDHGWVNVAVTSLTLPPRQGWVPRGCVEIGSGTYGEPGFKMTFLPTLTADIEVSDTDQTVFENTVACLLDALKAKQDQLYFIKEDMLALLNGKDLKSFTAHFIEGVKRAGYFDVLNTNFTIEDLMAAGKRVRESDSKRVGLYLRFYSNFLDNPMRKPCAYGGQTVGDGGFWKRMRGHDNDLKDEKDHRPHYLTARKSDPDNGRMARVFCVMRRNLPETWYLLAEQIQILLLNLYHGGVLRSSLENSFEAASNDVALASEAHPADLQGEAERTSLHYESAWLLSSLMADVSRKTGWPCAFGRLSFEGGIGLNWTSPLCEGQHSFVVWTKTETAEMEVYWRRGLLVMQQVSGALYIQFTTGRTIEVSLAVPRQTGLKKGDLVYPTIEITKTGRPHTHPWARLPLLRTFVDQEEANAVAVRLDWRKHGLWRRQYLSCSIMTSGLRSGEAFDEPVYPSYANAIALKAYLQMKRVKRSNSVDVKNFSIAKVRSMRFDFLSQGYLFDEIEEGDVKVCGKRQNPHAQIAQLKEAGAENIGIKWPSDFAALRFHARRKCDTCYILSKSETNGTHNGYVACKRDGTSNGCTLCKRLGRPCSWTLAHKLGMGGALWNLIKPVKLAPPPVKVVGNMQQLSVAGL